MVTDKDLERAQQGKEFQEESSLVKTGVTQEPLQDDVEPDKVVSDHEARLAHTPPDPVRNGGKAD